MLTNLHEALQSIKRIDQQPTDDMSSEPDSSQLPELDMEFDLDANGDDLTDATPDTDFDAGADDYDLDQPSPEQSLDGDEDIADTSTDDDVTDQQLDAVSDAASTDPDKQGVIRTVSQAHLIYKRQTDDGSYTELWIYSMGSMKDELKTRKAILAGTDIEAGTTTSPDGTQEYTTWAAGNAELIQITGLPN